MKAVVAEPRIPWLQLWGVSTWLPVCRLATARSSPENCQDACFWCSRAGSNRRPLDYQSRTLPAELHEHMAPREGLEPSQCPRTGTWRSVRLSYRGMLNGILLSPDQLRNRRSRSVWRPLLFTKRLYYGAAERTRTFKDLSISPGFQPGRVPIGAPLHVAQDRGFEPLEPLRAQRFSKPPQSASSANPAYGTPGRTRTLTFVPDP